MDKFLERHNTDLKNKLPKPFIYLKKKKKELVVKNLTQRKTPVPEGFTEAFYPTFMNELIPVLHKLF